MRRGMIAPQLWNEKNNPPASQLTLKVKNMKFPIPILSLSIACLCLQAPLDCPAYAEEASLPAHAEAPATQPRSPSATSSPDLPPWPPAYEESVWKRIEPHPINAASPSAPQKHGVGCRAIMSAILEATGTSGYAERSPKIEKAMENLESMQDRDPASKTYGNFRWYWDQPKPEDLNAVQFVTQRAVLLKLCYGDRLSSISPKASESLDRILTHAIEGIRRQKVDVAYTNIFLMKTWNLLALGQALNRPDLTDEGNAMLDAWIAFTRKNGITEYLSPTYLGIDLDSLGLMANQLEDPATKAKAEGALRFFWENIAANWFEPAQRLGGAHGRDYDYLTGHGALDLHLRRVGWIHPTAGEIPPPQPRFEDFTVFLELCHWTPPAELHQQALAQIPRFTSLRCGPNDTDWASQQIGHHVSIGVAGACKGGEDKPFAINLAGPAGPKTVMVNFFMDGRGDPYGTKKIPTGASGHNKAHHLVPTFRAVQSGGDVLFLASYSGAVHGSKKEPAPVCLYSHLDLPEEAVVWSTDQPLDPKQPSQAIPNNLCFLRLDDVAIGLKFLLAQDVAGQPVTVELVNDGHKFQAKRLSVTHSATPLGDGRGTVAVAVRAEEGLDEAGFAAFRKKFSEAPVTAEQQGTEITLSTEGAKNPLFLQADLRSGKLLRSEGADPSIQIAPLSVNGKKIDLETPSF